jgi:hypothetical protein
LDNTGKKAGFLFAYLFFDGRCGQFARKKILHRFRLRENASGCRSDERHGRKSET